MRVSLTSPLRDPSTGRTESCAGPERHGGRDTPPGVYFYRPDQGFLRGFLIPEAEAGGDTGGMMIPVLPRSG